MNIIKEIRRDIWSYWFVLPIIIVSDDTLLFGTSGIAGMEKAKFVILSLWGMWSFALNKYKLNSVVFIPLIFCGLFFMSSLINGGRISGGPLFLTLNLFIAINTCRRYDISSFARIFSNIIILISIYSLIVWIGVTCRILPTSSFENSAHQIIEMFGGCCFFKMGNSLLPRSSCFFREPGVYMIFICLSFILEAFILRNKISNKRLLIYVVSLLSTFSTAGFLIFGLLFIVYIFNSNSIRSNKSTLIFPILIAVGVVYVIINSEISTGVFDKLQRGEESVSYLGRLSSVTIPIDMIKIHPIFGIGIDGFKPLYESVSAKQFGIIINPDGMSTNTILNAAATFGIWFGLFMLIGLYKLCRQIKIKSLYQIMIFVSLLLALSNETLIYSAFIYWFIFYGYKVRTTK